MTGPDHDKLAHDLCNQVGAIRLRAEVLTSATDIDDLQYHVRAILSACENIMGLVGDLSGTVGEIDLSPPLPRTCRRDLEGLRILLVDDDPLLSEVMCEMLCDLGATTVHAASAVEALSELLGPDRDIALVDLGLLRDDAKGSILQCLQGACATLPVIFMSGSHPPDLPRSDKACFLGKPVALDTLTATIARMTGQQP